MGSQFHDPKDQLENSNKKVLPPTNLQLFKVDLPLQFLKIRKVLKKEAILEAQVPVTILQTKKQMSNIDRFR